MRLKDEASQERDTMAGKNKRSRSRRQLRSADELKNEESKRIRERALGFANGYDRHF